MNMNIGDTARRGSIQRRTAWCIAACLLLAAGCSRETAAPPQPKVETAAAHAAVAHAPPPTHFILCIDNSKSIKQQEQILIRETVMLLSDLADPGDMLSVVAFGTGAQTVASARIAGNEGRVAFKQQVRQGLDFSENFSDIRSAIVLLAQGAASPLLQQGFANCVVFMSDGKLEPADKRTVQAYGEMQTALQAPPLKGTNISAVVLGTTSCNDIIIQQDINGLKLMRSDVASSPDLFYHATSMDQLLDIAVLILNKAKGISSLGEQKDTAQFRIDDSVEYMSLIVRKRSTDGAALCASADIILNTPKSQPKDLITRSSDYQYFDLIAVRNPHEGMWSVSLKNGAKPDVLSKIITPLELRCSDRRMYYIGESAALQAWMIDNKKTGPVVSPQPYKLQARLEKQGDKSGAPLFYDFHADGAGSRYYLDAPGELLKALSLGDTPVGINLEIVAQRFKPNSKEIDPWFVRRLPGLAITIAEPFFTWTCPGGKLYKIPFWDKEILFGAGLDQGHARYSAMEAPPEVTFTLERFDEKQKTYQAVISQKLDRSSAGKTLQFSLRKFIHSLEPGAYRYQYLLSGQTKQGAPLDLRSAWLYTSIESLSAWFWSALVLLAAFIYFLFVYFSPRMIMVDKTPPLMHNKRIYYFKNPGGENSYKIQAIRWPFFKPRCVLKVIKGTINFDGAPLRANEKNDVKLKKEHIIEYTKKGDTVKVTFEVRRIK